MRLDQPGSDVVIPSLPQYFQRRFVVAAKGGLVDIPQTEFENSGDGFRPDFAPTVLQGLPIPIHVPQYEMCVGFGTLPACPRLAMRDDKVWPCSLRVQFEPHRVAGLNQRLIRTRPAGVHAQMMESRGRFRSVPENLHVAHGVGHGRRDRIPDCQNADGLVLGLGEVRQQIGTVRARPAMFGVADNHDWSGSSV